LEGSVETGLAGVGSIRHLEGLRAQGTILPEISSYHIVEVAA